jgi:hypothetical protein
MIECAFTGRLGHDAELRRVKSGSLAMLAFSAAVEDGQAADDVPVTWCASWCSATLLSVPGRTAWTATSP